MPFIYHITTKEEWRQAQEDGFYQSPTLTEEGFIHCSQENQVSGVLERYFSDKKDLVKLVIDTDKLNNKIIFEWSPSSQDTFPHIYGPINKEAVIDVVQI
jgi:uncharacterized protein (DUF952 family)